MLCGSFFFFFDQTIKIGGDFHSKYPVTCVAICLVTSGAGWLFGEKIMGFLDLLKKNPCKIKM